MVGSIDPRCETVRGTHWPKKGREVVWSSRRGNHLGQRSTDRINRPDIWMQAIRSDSEKLLWHGGRPTMGPCVRGDGGLLVLRRDDGEKYHSSFFGSFDMRSRRSCMSFI